MYRGGVALGFLEGTVSQGTATTLGLVTPLWSSQVLVPLPPDLDASGMWEMIGCRNDSGESRSFCMNSGGQPDPGTGSRPLSCSLSAPLKMKSGICQPSFTPQ